MNIATFNRMRSAEIGYCSRSGLRKYCKSLTVGYVFHYRTLPMFLTNTVNGKNIWQYRSQSISGASRFSGERGFSLRQTGEDLLHNHVRIRSRSQTASREVRNLVGVDFS